jgi:TolA-binding protein
MLKQTLRLHLFLAIAIPIIVVATAYGQTADDTQTIQQPSEALSVPDPSAEKQGDAASPPSQEQPPDVKEDTQPGQQPSEVLSVPTPSVEKQGDATPPPSQEQPPAVDDQDVLLQGANNYRQGNYEEAFDLLVKARARDPKSSVAAYYLGATLKRMQRFNDAIPHLRDAVTLQPPVDQAFLELADAYYAVDRTDEALHALAVSERQGIEPGQTAFLKGLVYAKKRKHADAVVFLEKAKAIDSKLTVAADVQIAMIYQRLGRQTEARDLFQSVADKDPDSEAGLMARQQADDLTARLNKKFTFTVTANAQEQYDSNVLLKPDSASSATDISGKSDTSTALSLRAEYIPVVRAPYGRKFLYNAYLNAYRKLKTYDIQSHTLGATFIRQMGENSASLPIMFNYTLLDNSKYLQALALTPTFTFVTGEDQYAQAQIKYQKKNYASAPMNADEDRNSYDAGAGLSWFHLIAEQKGFLSFKYEFNREAADGANWSYMGNKIGAGALVPCPSQDRLKLALNLEAFRQNFDKINTFYGLQRTDTSYTGSAQLLYKLTRTVDAQLMYIAMNTDSTIPVYEYHKSIVSVGLNARF